MKYFKSFLNFSKKTIIFLFAFILTDIVFFVLIPSDIKSKLYNNRAHRIKSYYYHHDLRPMSSFYDHWGYERYKIQTNSLGFKDEFNRNYYITKFFKYLHNEVESGNHLKVKKITDDETIFNDAINKLIIEMCNNYFNNDINKYENIEW